MSVFFDIDDDKEEIEIDIDDVNSSTSETQLSAWYTQMDDLTFRIRAFVEAKKFVERADDEWLDRVGGKLAYLKIGMRRVETRMLDLGLAVPYAPQSPLRYEIRQLLSKNKKLQQLLKEHGVTVVDVSKAA